MKVLFCVCFLANSLAVLSQSSTSLAVFTQKTQDEVQHIILEMTGDNSQVIEKITFKFEDEVQTSLLREGHLPKGWTYATGRHKVTLSGPPTHLPFKARVNMGRQESGRQIGVKVKGGGLTHYDKDIFFLKALPPLQPITSLRSLLALPPMLVPGDRVEMRITDLVRTPPEGEWEIAGQKVKPESDPHFPGSWYLRFTVSPTLQPGSPVRVSYRNDLGLELVAVAQAPSTRVVAAPTSQPASPRLFACGQRGIQSGALCVAGWFPDEKARHGLLIDGVDAGIPLTVSNQALYLPILPSLRPGKHILSGDPKAGFGADDHYEFEVITVQAELDRTELVANQESQLNFYVVGTEAPLKIKVYNMTPEIIQIQGGNEQIIESLGGGGNFVTRAMETKALGNFLIEYELAEERCPCTATLSESGLIQQPKP